MAQSDTEKDEKRQIVLDTLGFLVKERNIALFELSAAKAARIAAQKAEQDARNKSRFLKRRLINEIDRNLDLLNPEDKERLIGEEE